MRFLLLIALVWPGLAQAQTDARYGTYPAYPGSDLGLTYSGKQAHLRVWAPTADAVALHLYADGIGGKPTATHAMKKAEGGTWMYVLPAAGKGFYTVQATIGGKKMAEVADPYAHAVGINGKRAALLDAAAVKPAGWDADARPVLKQLTDIVIGELHVRDLSMSPTSGITHKGKFLGFTEAGTKGPGGVSTGLDHLAELGLTHVHLLPTNDYNSVDEANPAARYNWGYDPLNYTVPEGSYATDAANPSTRILEFKEMVGAMHKKGLRVVLDVVYNHVADAGKSNFEQLVPGYYFRHKADGKFSDASGCGNEVASERPMVRKMIVESVVYWASVYKVDGFRFDLMGILDMETMRAVRKELDRIDPTIYIYGEGWTAGSSPLPDNQRALKGNTYQMTGVAAFCDDLRDAVKGHYARQTEPGFASGRPGLDESIRFGIVAAGKHPQIDYAKVNYSKAPWTAEPAQCINYVACHDDMVLWDKLAASNPTLDEETRIQLDLLCNTIVFTSQGVPFLPVGDDFLRTKGGSHNSYNLPDSVNQFDWGRKAKYREVAGFYQALIGLRKAHPAFRLPTADLIAKHLEFLPGQPEGLVAYHLKDNAGGDSWKDITVIFNGNRTVSNARVPVGDYVMVLRGPRIDLNGFEKVVVPEAGMYSVQAGTAVVLVR